MPTPLRYGVQSSPVKLDELLDERCYARSHLYIFQQVRFPLVKIGGMGAASAAIRC